MKTLTRNKQRGAVSLLTAIILLICITLVVLLTSKTVMMETKITADDYRTTQATAAAQAAMDHATAYFGNGGMDQNNDNIVDFTTPTTAQMPSMNSCAVPTTPALAETLVSGTQNTIAMFYLVNTHFYDANNDGTIVTTGSAAEINPCDNTTFYDHDNNTATPDIARCISTGATCLDSTPLPVDKGLIIAKGWSDDCTAIRTITQCVNTFELFNNAHSPGGAAAPSAVLGVSSVQVNGTANLINRITQSNVWAGDPSYSVNGGLKTYLRTKNTNVSDFTLAELLDPNTPTNTDNHNLQPISDVQTGNGIDVVAGDKTLAKVGFSTFFSQTKEEVAANAASDPYPDPPATATTTHKFTNIDDAPTGIDRVVFISGDTSLSGTKVLGTPDIAATGSTPAIPAKPVTLIVDGDFTWTGGTIYGLVYVTGKIHMGGTATLIGSAISESATPPSGTGGGNPTIVYRPMGGNLISKDGENIGYNLTNFSKKGIISGSWKDW